MNMVINSEPETQSQPAPETRPSNAGGIAKASAIMMVTVLASRILGVLRDSIIAYYFGRGAATDAYQAAFTVPDLLFYLLQSGALSSTIVPIITEYRQLGKHRDADYTVSIVASTIFVVIGLLICVMWIKARALTIMLNPGFDAGRIAMAVPLTRILLPAQMFFFLGGLMMGVLYSRKEFLIPALGPVIYNSGIIFGGVALHHWLHIEGLVWGAIGGAFVGNFLIPFIRVRQLGVHLKFSLHVLHPSARKVWAMLLPMGLGVALPNIDQIVNKLFASYLGAGETTAIMNAYRLMLLPIGIFAQALALAVYPTFAGQAAQHDYKGLRETMNASLRNILFMTVPASVLMFLLATPVITFLLQSGKYTASDTAATAGALQALSVGIFAWSTQSLLTRGFYALQNSRIPVISGICVSVIFVFMNWFVVHHTSLGVVGLGLSTSIAATIHATALTILLSRRLNGIHGALLLVSTIKTLIATGGLLAATWAVQYGLTIVFPLSHIPKLSALIILLGASAAGVAAFMGIAKMLHMPELRDALRLLDRFKRRRTAANASA